MNQIIGKRFIAKCCFPFVDISSLNNAEDFSYDIIDGEEILITDFDGEYYTVNNINLDEVLAWVKVTPVELNTILGL